jgi:hypothetical protein
MTKFNEEMKKEMAAARQPLSETESQLAKEIEGMVQMRGTAANAFAAAHDATNAASGPEKKVTPPSPSAPAPM